MWGGGGRGRGSDVLCGEGECSVCPPGVCGGSAAAENIAST